MKILITGSSGFIGSNLLKLLNSNNHTIISLDKNIDKNIICKKRYELDINNIDDIPSDDANGIDCIIHLAAVHKDNIKPVDLYYKTNYIGTNKVINFASKYKINKIIFTSTVAIYGVDVNGCCENDTPNPFNDYGRSKIMAENKLNEWYKLNKSRTLIIIRPTVVFGPKNRGNVYNLISQINNKKFIMIGKGNNKKSLAFVDNLVMFILVTLDLNKGIFVYNYSDKPDLKIKNLIHQIYNSLNLKKNRLYIPKYVGLLSGIFLDIFQKIVNHQFNISYIRIKKFTSSSVVSISKLQKDFPDLKNVDLNKAIDLTINADFKNKEIK